MHEITCKRCGGSGKHSLHPVYGQTLEILRRFAGISAANVAKSLGVSHAVACNRLKKLEELGVCTVEQRGSKRVWRIANDGKRED